MKAASKKAKGARLEAKVVTLFAEAGWFAQRVPGSGVYKDFPHDVTVEHAAHGPLLIEAKKHREGWRTGDKYLGQANILVIERDRGQPMAYMPLSLFLKVAR